MITPVEASPSRSPWRSRHTAHDAIAFLERLARRGDIVAFSLGRHPAFLLNHPTLVEDVLVTSASNFSKPAAFERSRILLGTSLLTAEGELHRQRRQIAHVAFGPSRMERYASIVVRAVEQLTNGWRDGQVVDMESEMRRLTLGVIGSILFDVDLTPHAGKIGHALATVGASIDPLFSLLAPARAMKPAAEYLRGFIDRQIDTRVDAGEGGDDLQSVLRRAEGTTGQPVSDQLRDDVFTLFVAGHDTIANALIWTWHLLAIHPEAETRLHSELSERLAGRTPDWSDVAHVPYTGWVLAEVLRLYPPAWVITRRALTEQRIAGVSVPAGAIVVMSQHLIHRDDRFFSEAAAFRPERWTASLPVTRLRLSYFPFGAGPRACIGQGLGLLEGTLAVAAIARAWRCRPCGSVDRDPRATLRPAGPVPTRLERLARPRAS